MKEAAFSAVATYAGWKFVESNLRNATPQDHYKPIMQWGVVVGAGVGAAYLAGTRGAAALGGVFMLGVAGAIGIHIIANKGRWW